MKGNVKQEGNVGDPVAPKEGDVAGATDPTPTGQPTDQEPDSFTAVDPTRLDRDSLPDDPDVRAAYDHIDKMKKDMQSDYTKTKMEMANQRKAIEDNQRFIDVGRLAVEVPEVRDLLDRVARGDNLPSSPQESAAPVQQQVAGDQDPFTVIEKIFDDKLEPIRQRLDGVTSFVNTSQAGLEFKNLVTEFPGAQSLGMDRINMARARVGGQMTMRQAFCMLAAEEPDLLRTAEQLRAPFAGQPSNPRLPIVETPSGVSNDSIPARRPRSGKELIEEVKERKSKGMIGNLADDVKRALARMDKGE